MLKLPALGTGTHVYKALTLVPVPLVRWVSQLVVQAAALAQVEGLRVEFWGR